MPKHTKLNDDATIYQPRNEQSEKEKLKDMPMKMKISYLWEYYKIHGIVILAAIVLTTYIIHGILNPKPEIRFQAAMINNVFTDQTIEATEIDFSNFLNLDPESERVFINPSFYFNGPADYVMNSTQALTTYIAAQEIDVIIAPETEFLNYAKYETFSKLSEQLPTDLYSSLTDHFYYAALDVTPEQEDVYGIYLTDSVFFKDIETPEPYIIGIIVNSKYKGNAVEFIRYLFDTYQ